MLDKIIGFSVRNKLIILLFVAGLVTLGVYEIGRLPIDAQPDITNNQVQVITVAPSYGAADIERLVTFPIEQAVSNIADVTEIRSYSRFGLSLVTIVFDDRTDVYLARQQVSERIQQVKDDIPVGIGTPELGPISTGLGEIFQYVVRPQKGYEDRYDETELRTIQDWVIRRQLLGTKGVADVSSFGGKLKQYEIAVNPNLLQAFNLTINDLFLSLEQNNQNTGGAYIEKGETTLFIRTEGLIGSIESIEEIPVSSTLDGTPVLLKDVAKVGIGFATRYGAMTYNDAGEVSGAIVLMLKGENANLVVRNIKERLATIEKSLPEGVVIEPFLDRAKMVNNTISTVKTNLLEGCLIVVFILVVFLGNFRAGFIVASVIPLSVFFAVIMMNWFKVGGNLMSLGALDFGLIVDGAVIIVEAVLHQLAFRKPAAPGYQDDRQSRDREVTGAASKMANSAVFGQIIILIVYLPIFSLEGIEGKMFKPMAQTVAFALIGAFILSLTYIPVMSALFLKRGENEKRTFSDRMMAILGVLHRKGLVNVLKFRKTVLTIVLLLFAGALYLLSNMGGEFIPSLEEGDFAVEMRILQGSSINKTKEITTKAARILLDEFDEVEKVVTKIGSAEIPTEPMPMDAGDMIIVLKPKKEWTSAKSFPELSEKMSQALQAIPGLTTGFQFPVQMRFNELMTGARQDVVCKIYGEDLDSLARFAEKLGAIINTVQGAEDLYLEPVIGAPQVVIEYDRSALARYRIPITDANRLVNMSFAGQSAGLVYEGERRFDLVVRLDEEQKRNIDDIRNVKVPSPSGIQVPLHQLASVHFKSVPNQIQRENTRRRIVVGFNIRGRDVQSVVEDLRKRVDQELRLPSDYIISYGGAFENLNHAKSRLAIAVPASLILIFILLFFAFHSVRQGLLIYTAIPLSAIGGIYFLALRGMPFSISAGIGFIALFGVAVLNGIVLVSEFNRLQKSGILNLPRIVISGTRTRLRPVLMTAFVASLGFLPMALSTGSGAEVQRPLATVVIGGLLLATFLTLFVLPLLYVLLNKPRPVSITSPARGLAMSIPLTLLFSLSTIGITSAQNSVTYEQAIEKALLSNLDIKKASSEARFLEVSRAGFFDAPQSEISTEYGRLEGVELDNRLSIGQRINFPTVYVKRRALLDAQWQSGVLAGEVTRKQVVRAVTDVFFRGIVLIEKRKLLVHTDSLFKAFSGKFAIRLQKGEGTALESSAANIQSLQISNQLTMLDKELHVITRQLQLLLNAGQPLYPASPVLILEPDSLSNDSVFRDHTELRLLESEIKVSEAASALESSKLLPDLSLAYNNQSIKNVHDGRFSSIQIGVGIQIFNRAQRATASAARIRRSISETNYLQKQVELANLYRQTMTELRYYQRVADSYLHEMLPETHKMNDQIQKQLEAGEIDFLNWVLLTNQSVKVRSDYLDVIDQLNGLTSRLNYLVAH